MCGIKRSALEAAERHDGCTVGVCSDQHHEIFCTEAGAKRCSFDPMNSGTSEVCETNYTADVHWSTITCAMRWAACNPRSFRSQT